MDGPWYQTQTPTKEEVVDIIKSKYNLEDTKKQEILNESIKKYVINEKEEYGSYQGFYIFVLPALLKKINNDLLNK